MSDTHYPAWRPLSSLDINSMRDALAGPVSLWRNQWFVDKSIELSDGEYVGPHSIPAHLLASFHTMEDQLFHLDAPPAIRKALGALALDTTPTAMKVPAPVGQALENFCRMLLDDLKAKLQQLLSSTAPAVAIGSGRQPFLHGAMRFAIRCHDELTESSIWLPYETVRHQLPSSPTVPRNRAPLSRRQEAIEKTNVYLESVLGHTTLTLAELLNVEVGDVIRLETRLEDDATLLLVHGSGRLPIASAAVTQDGTSLVLHIETLAA